MLEQFLAAPERSPDASGNGTDRRYDLHKESRRDFPHSGPSSWSNRGILVDVKTVGWAQPSKIFSGDLCLVTWYRGSVLRKARVGQGSVGGREYVEGVKRWLRPAYHDLLARWTAISSW